MAEDALALEAPIRAVTVFRRGAVVQRVARWSGEQRALKLTGLPLCLDDASVVARVSGPGAPAVTGVRVALEVTDVDLPEPPEQQAVDEARLAEAHATSQVAYLERQAKALAALRSPERPQGKRGEAPPAVPLGARLALLDFQDRRLSQVHDRLARAREEVRTARELREKLEHDLKTATTDRPPRARELRKSAHLTLLGGTDPSGEWTLELEYLVPGARWTPSYSLRFDAGLREVQVDLRAAVAQRTGEDWSGVELTVSTARPMSWTELPELPALRIGKRQATLPRTGWRPAPEGADALYDDYRAAAAARPRPRPAPATPRKRAEPLEIEEEALAGDLFMDEAPEPAPVERVKAKKGRGPARRRSRGGAPPAPPPPQAAPMMSRAMAPSAAMPAEAAASLGAAAPGGGSAEPPPPTELTAPESLLDYGRLRLAGPDARRPGVLEPASRLQLYQEHVTIERITIDRRVLSQLDQSRSHADLSSLALPAGHSQPAAIHDFDHAWRAEHPVDLDSDGAWHTLSITRSEAPASRRFVVVPREASEVFRTASFVNPLDAPLPAGPADVFVGGELLLTAPLRATDQGGTVRLGLGVEEGIKVARNTRFRERSSGLISTTLSLEHEVDVEVANRLGLDAEVEVRERLPVHREDDDEIEITQVRTEPPWRPWEQDARPVRGSHRWVVSVPAGEQTELRLRYTVEISGKKELVGGNRRES